MTQDAERSLGTCNATIEPEGAGRSYATVCTLPSNHTGSHDDHPPLSPGERTLEEARHLAQQTDQLTNRLARLTADIDRRTASGQGLDPDQRRLLNELTTKLNAVSYNAARLARETPTSSPTTTARSRRPRQHPASRHPRRHRRTVSSSDSDGSGQASAAWFAVMAPACRMRRSPRSRSRPSTGVFATTRSSVDPDGSP